MLPNEDHSGAFDLMQVPLAVIELGRRILYTARSRRMVALGLCPIFAPNSAGCTCVFVVCQQAHGRCRLTDSVPLYLL